MVSKRLRAHLNKLNNKSVKSPTTTNIFKNLITAFESSEGIKSQLLKNTYYLLHQLSLKQQLCMGKETDLNELFKTNEGEVRCSLRDVYTLSSILFKDLQKRLKQLHSSKNDVSPSRSLELDELNLLIRCCVVILTIPLPQKHLLESGQILLQIFKKLSLLEVARGCHENADFITTSSCQRMYRGENPINSVAKVACLSSLEIFDPCIPSITATLEVLIDELLVHGRLRKYLQIIDSLSPTNERLFKCGSDGGDFGVFVEIICSHFLLSIPDEGALQEFLNNITWLHINNFKYVELNTIAASALLRNPIVLSSPKLLQAHIVSLVSGVVSVGIDGEILTSDPMLIDFYLSAFESSVILYTQHMSILKPGNHSTDARDFTVNVPSYESCIEPAKMQKLDEMIYRLNDSWNSNLKKKFFKRKPDLIASSIEYIQQNLWVLDIACRDEILTSLRCILMRAANDVNDIELPLTGDAWLQDICLLASLLMLMSNSLIQAIRSIHRSKEYDFIGGIINCFKEFSICLPIQKFAYTMMDLTSHKESRMMLLHFLGLLSLCFDSGLDFLVNSCISVIMALTNLLVLEEGNVDALRSLADPRPSSSSEEYHTVYKEALVWRYPTRGVVAKFQKIRALYMSNASAKNDLALRQDVGVENLSNTLVPLSMEESVSVRDETCTGEAYLKTRFKGLSNLADFDDLADFVECKKEKDYAGWMKDRMKFRERKLLKQAKLRWEKKKKAWRSIRRKI